MKRHLVSLLLGAVTLGVVTGAAPRGGEAQDMPCTKEIEAFCSDVQVGGGRILECLKKNDAMLSPSCVHRMRDLEAAFSGPLSVCRDDWAAYCYHPRASGGENIQQCLLANQAKVSTACQKALEGAAGMRRQQNRGAMP